MVNDPHGPMTIVITITVQDSEGRPLIGADVRLSPQISGGNGRTGPDGAVKLTVVDGTYTAGASKAGYKSKSDVPLDDNNMATIQLEAE